MAVTTTVLGVVASIALSRSSFYITSAQHLTALQADQWSYYQAKSIKQDLFATQEKAFQYKLLTNSSPAKKDSLNQAIQDFSKGIIRYDQEKLDIKKKADDIKKQSHFVVRRGSQFSLAIVFAQIGIMLSSIGVLLKRIELWILGLVFGFISLIFLVNGFLLFF